MQNRAVVSQKQGDGDKIIPPYKGTIWSGFRAYNKNPWWVQDLMVSV